MKTMSVAPFNNCNSRIMLGMKRCYRSVSIKALFASLIIRLFQLIFSTGTVFFSHNKSAETAFWLVFSAKRTGPMLENVERLHALHPNRNWAPLSFLVCTIVFFTTSTMLHPIHFAYKTYFFNQRTVFFFHNKSANSTFSHGLLAKWTGH